MIIDADQFTENVLMSSEFCVIGSGPAGLAVAMTLAASGRDVCMLEAGGLTPDVASARLSRVINAGELCVDPSLRRAFAFGGTSWIWSGWIRPFDRIDYEQREWIKDSGWPIDYDDVAPYLHRAAELLGLKYGLVDASREHTEAKSQMIWDQPDGVLESGFFNVMRDVPRLGLMYQQHVETLPTLRLVLHAHALHVIPGFAHGLAKGVQVCNSSGKPFVVHAQNLILACGAIDNVRLLLETHDRAAGHGLPMPSSLGRYFMMRLHASGGFLHAPDRNAPYPDHYCHEKGDVVRRLFTTSAIQKRHQLHRYNVSFVTDTEADTAYRRALMWPVMAASCTRRRFIAATALAGAAVLTGCAQSSDGWRMTLNHTAEQAPNPDSRIVLSRECDPHGARLAKVDWQTLPDDWRSMAASSRLMARQIKSWRRGEVDLGGFDDRCNSGLPGIQQGSPGHYMGGTRMGRDVSTSVVDENCLVHGTQNVYIAGSSVFPTSGAGTPTLTLVAMALRLAKHLHQR